MSEIILLRTLTLKSKLGKGKYSNSTIDEIIKDGKTKYLAWAYYSLCHINFTNEILDLLKINIEDRISKPGVDHQKYFDLYPSKRQRRFKLNFGLTLPQLDYKIDSNCFVSKSRNRAFNQGGFKPFRHEISNQKEL
jgi:hypothetical protein